MRDHERDEEYLRKILKSAGVKETVYITENTYDGGYEIRCGTLDFFVDYETIDEDDVATIMTHIRLFNEQE